MSDPTLECRARLKDTQAEIDRFESQAATILAFTLTLSVVSYGILMQVLFYDARLREFHKGVIRIIAPA